jgi:poly(beta-D-mannuronate) lyase
MKKIIIILAILIIPNLVFGSDFKKIKKKATVTKSEIIFPIPNDLNGCQTKMRVSLKYTKVPPILKLDAPEGYGLDDRFSDSLSKFDEFSFPCGTGNKEACKSVVQILLDWANADAAKRTGPSDEEGKHWNDTLTVNLFVSSPMMAAYSFAKQVIDVPKDQDKKIKGWFKKIVKKNNHLMYGKTYDYGGARGTPKRAHNHALSSAVAHMELGVLMSDDKTFRKAFKNFEAAIKYSRKDGSLPIETRRGGRAMFYQARAMNALAVIAMIAENQGYDIWSYNHKNKDYHNLVKFFIDVTEKNELIFKYAKESRHPGPAKDYKKQDLLIKTSSNWGWLYAYASRFPNHENIKRLEKWSSGGMDLNSYQRKIVHHFRNIGNIPFGSATWSVVEPNCHSVKK